MASLAVASAPRDLARAALCGAAFLYPALLTSFGRVPGQVLGASLVLSLLFLPGSLQARRALFSRADAAPLAGLAAFLVVATIESLAWHAPLWMGINTFRLLGLAFVVAAIRLLQPSSRGFYRGCAVGAVAAGAVAVWQVAVTRLARAEGLAPPFGEPLTTIFAGLAVVLAFLPVAAGRPGHRTDTVLAACGLVGGVVAGMLSGSRSAWVATGVLAAWCFARGQGRRLAVFVAAFLVATFALDEVASRWSMGVSDLVQYGQGHAATSLGTRIELWKAALAAFAQHPLFGVGPDGFHDWLVVRERAGLTPGSALAFGHAHSELLHALATGGLLHATVLVLAFVLPWRRFRQAAARRDSPAARAGQTLVLGFAVVGIADTFLIHRVALTCYVVFAAWLLAWAEQPSDRW